MAVQPDGSEYFSDVIPGFDHLERSVGFFGSQALRPKVGNLSFSDSYRDVGALGFQHP